MIMKAKQSLKKINNKNNKTPPQKNKVIKNIEND